MELATNTMTADKTMGIQRAESETIGSLLRAQRRMRKFSPRGYPRAVRGQAGAAKVSFESRKTRSSTVGGTRYCVRIKTHSSKPGLSGVRDSVASCEYPQRRS